MEKEIEELGINVEEFNKKVAVTLRKYLAAFHKEMVKENIEDYDFFFSDDDYEFILSIQFICANHPEWFEKDLNAIEEKEFALTFAKELLEEETGTITELPSLDERIALLNRTGFSSNTCWKLMLMLQSPQEKIEKLSKIIHSNAPAYEKAVAAIQRPLDKLLEDFPHGKYLFGSLHQNSNVTPTLVYPAVELVHANGEYPNSYIGLFTDAVYKMQEKEKSSQKNLLPMLKALSDSSKFDILLSLMKSPKYNLELAEELKLSAATISHHMNVLLNCRLVNVEKKDGRVYYTLSKETVENLLLKLRTMFLE
ncbi:ArsR family transcriptional regulator [Konateibacter massiliensis]|uniref:ArsR family transcriptional regulator n=1 Tax=Konateibacter massiliensis TaxID=2002841 RepID=UPI0015D4EB5E|nr:ArsR family transcriptional regulator [Konateibacter massiliensis]